MTPPRPSQTHEHTDSQPQMLYYTPNQPTPCKQLLLCVYAGRPGLLQDCPQPTPCMDATPGGSIGQGKLLPPTCCAHTQGYTPCRRGQSAPLSAAKLSLAT
jgi:hypothetical protein